MFYMVPVPKTLNAFFTIELINRCASHIAWFHLKTQLAYRRFRIFYSTKPVKYIVFPRFHYIVIQIVKAARNWYSTNYNQRCDSRAPHYTHFIFFQHKGSHYTNITLLTGEVYYLEVNLLINEKCFVANIIYMVRVIELFTLAWKKSLLFCRW